MPGHVQKSRGGKEEEVRRRRRRRRRRRMLEEEELACRDKTSARSGCNMEMWFLHCYRFSALFLPETKRKAFELRAVADRDSLESLGGP
jgi:hypothetical protein